MKKEKQTPYKILEQKRNYWEMKFKKEETKLQELKKENKELKQSLAVALNKPLLRRLTNGIRRIQKGDYYTEEEFRRKVK